jgi:uncharacterized membrane protein
MHLISSRQRRRRFTTHVSDVEFTLTGSVLVPVTKVSWGPRETAISRDRWLVMVTIVVWCALWVLVVLRRAWNKHVSFGETEETQVYNTTLRCWFDVMSCVLVPVTKVSYGPRETTISRDQWLVAVTVVVWCPLWICVISNGHQPVTVLRSFVTLDR